MATSEHNLPDALAALAGAVGSKDAAPLSPARAAELAELLVQFTLVLDQLAWRIWRDLAPASSLKRPPAFKSDLAKFLSADPAVSREQVQEQLDRLRKVLAGLTSAAPKAGEIFASRHVQRLGPASVEAAAVRGTMPVIGDRKETACWRKFQELAKDLESDALARELLTLWGETAEKIITGGDRHAGS